MDYQNPNNRLTKEQKTGFVLLLIFGVLAVGLGALQIRNNIFSPFVVKVTKEEQDVSNLLMDETARLQSIDTDHDELSDFEELNFYETSPYLADTDSDGVSDKEEVTKGTNPNCAEGQSCNTAETLIISTSTLDLSSDLAASVNSSSPALDFLSSVASGGAGINSEIKDWMSNPKKLREILLSSGSVTKEQLAGIDDATLLQVFKDVLVEKGGAQLLVEDSSTSSSANFPVSTTTLN